MFWRVITFISALAAVSSAAVAQSDVTVEQTGSVDPDKSMFGFKLPSKKLTITSSPPGAELTLIYSKGKLMSFAPVNGSKTVRCKTPCEYKLPQTAIYLVRASLVGHHGEFVGKAPEWQGGLLGGWLLRPNTMHFYFTPLAAGQTANQVIVGVGGLSGLGVEGNRAPASTSNMTTKGANSLQGTLPQATVNSTPTTNTSINKPLLSVQPQSASNPRPGQDLQILENDDIVDKAMYRCEIMSYTRGTAGFRKCVQQQIELITKSDN